MNFGRYKGIYIKTTHDKYGRKGILMGNATGQIPKIIEGNYTSDYDIFYVDSVIKKKLQKDIYSIEEEKMDEIRKREAIIEDRNSNYTVKMENIHRIEQIRDEIEYITSGKKYLKYVEETKDLLEEYRLLKEKSTKILFGEDVVEDILEDENKVKKIVVIEKYLDIARDYFPIDIVNIFNIERNKCLNCYTELKDENLTEEGLRVCPNPLCNAIYPSIVYKTGPKDSDRYYSSNNDENSIENFNKLFLKKQGLQKLDCLEEICTELDIHCERTGLKTGEEIRNLPLDERGRRVGTSLEMLKCQLAEIGRNKNYEDAELIAQRYWGWKLPNYMHIYDKVMKIFYDTLKVFNSIPEEQRCRKSNLGNQFVLYKILQMLKEKVTADDFKIAKNRDSKELHNRLWEIMCKEAMKINPDIRYIP